MLVILSTGENSTQLQERIIRNGTDTGIDCGIFTGGN